MAKVRCSSCRGFVDKQDARWHGSMVKFCSELCEHAYRTKVTKPKKTSVRPVVVRGIRPALRNKVLLRDGWRCRYCSTNTNLHLHHVLYRSGGLPEVTDQESNLLTLCLVCHQLVHTNKRYYQPLLRGIIWLSYCGEYLTVPQFERRLQDAL